MLIATACVIIGLVLLVGLTAWFELDGEFHEPEDVFGVTIVAFVAVILTGYGAWSLGSWWGVIVAVFGVALCLLIIRNLFQSFPRF